MATVTVDPKSGCWIPPQKPHSGGYVRVNVLGTFRPMHVLAYEFTYGSVPEGHLVDHQCHNMDASCEGGPSCPHRRCCNPAHLVVATATENFRRGRAAGALGRWQSAKTQCPRGHAYTPENTRQKRNGSRDCRTCHREAQRARYHRAMARKRATA